MGVTVIIHALGTLETIAYLSRVLRQQTAKPRALASERQIVRLVGLLLLLHLLEAGVWAAFFLAAGVLPDIETAVYFSLTSYTTVGYGDVVLPSPWRILGPMEAATGVLMLGWSTGIMVTAIPRIYRSQLRLPNDIAGEGTDA
jgi:hypothetical protein